MVRFGLIVAGVVLALDQVSKVLIIHFFDTGDAGIVQVVPGFFNMVLVWNRGISFGMLSNDLALGPWVLSAFAVAITIGLFIWLRQATRRFVAAALGLTIGGAIGNVIDRVRFGAVFDFLDFYVGGWHWPAFNLADAAITVGVGALFLVALLERPQRTKLNGR